MNSEKLYAGKQNGLITDTNLSHCSLCWDREVWEPSSGECCNYITLDLVEGRKRVPASLFVVSCKSKIKEVFCRQSTKHKEGLELIPLKRVKGIDRAERQRGRRTRSKVNFQPFEWLFERLPSSRFYLFAHWRWLRVLGQLVQFYFQRTFKYLINRVKLSFNMSWVT